MKRWLMATPLWMAATLTFGASTLWFATRTPPYEGAAPRPPTARRISADARETESASDELELVHSLRRGETSIDLTALIDDPRQRVAQAAISSLADLGASDILIAALDPHGSSWRERALIGALGRIGDSDSVAELAHLLQLELYDKEPIIDALGASHNALAVPPLREVVGGRSSELVVPALEALSTLAVEQADNAIRQAATDERDWVRAQALAWIPDPDSSASQAILRSALSDDDEDVVIAAAFALTPSSTALKPELEACLARRNFALTGCAHALVGMGAGDLVVDLVTAHPEHMELLSMLRGSPEATASLEALSRAPDPRIRIEALSALAQQSQAAQQQLMDVAADLDPAQQIEIARRLIRQGAPGSVELLVGVAVGRVPIAMRTSALRILANSDDGVRALRDLARSDSTVRQSAMNALFTGSRPLVSDDVDLIERALDAGDAGILARLQNQMTPQLQASLEARLHNGDIAKPVMELLAMSLPIDQLLHLAGDDPSLQQVAVLNSVDDHPRLDAIVRSQAQAAPNLSAFLQQFGTRSPGVHRYLRNVIEHGEPADRRMAMGRISQIMSTEELAVYASNQDVEIRKYALDALRSNPGAAATTEIALRGITDADPRLRRTSVSLLDESSSRQARRALLYAIEDPDETVARKAIAAVLRVGGEITDTVIELAFATRIPLERRRAIADRILSDQSVSDPELLVRLSELAER